MKKIYSDRRDKNYIVLAAAGHCGHGKFRPVLHWSNTDSVFDANEEVKNYPRIKHDKKYTIITSTECTYHEGLLVKMINDKDGFLTENDNSENPDKSVDDRGAVLDLIDLYRKTRDNSYLDAIRTKEYYCGDDKMLQRFCAPRRIRNEIIYDKNYDLRLVLGEYFTYYVKKLATSPMPKIDTDLLLAAQKGLKYTPEQYARYSAYIDDKIRRVRMHIIYHGLFGENNPLGIEFDGKTVSYINTNGEKESYSVPQGEPLQNDDLYNFKIKRLLTQTGKIEPIYASNQITY